MEVDGEKLMANLAKNRYLTPRQRNDDHANRLNLNPPAARGQQSGYRSFADVVRPAREDPKGSNTEGDILTFIPKDGMLAWLQRSMFVVLKNPMELCAVSELVPSPERGVSKVIPLGGVAFLIVFETAECMQKLANDKDAEALQVFHILRPWKEGDVAHNRLCWILIKGVPPNAWSKEFFQFIVSSFGSMVDWSPKTRSQTRMDVAEILILTDKVSFINKVLRVKYGNISYKIGMSESQYEPFDWVWSESGGGSPAAKAGMVGKAIHHDVHRNISPDNIHVDLPSPNTHTQNHHHSSSNLARQPPPLTQLFRA
ncbi:hypothetical protein Tsubulata_027738 [Turnera subulata]|uniref:DUF4283 domain-containing protein n=1 Tax=Turnera subulata TaxID=218843 RepID=A0A9Q0FT22_9ROSI|nr:hypothetical protein Tsubulata_027738 [Turnera subulata]